MSRPRFIALLLALVTLLAYLPVVRDGFVNYDDQTYVTENPVVQKGLTWTGIQWAFTTGHGGNWHPLTWLSLMLDDELFGINAGAFHFVNVLFHAANTVLLFVLLWRLAGALWPAAFIAALFAWHPLHVESVAWIAERKDVLSTFFALLTLLAYAKYAMENCHRSFWLALIFFALGLMSKPMLVTLPFVMLLLDFWPVQRFNGSTVQRLFIEKIPFFALSAISCIVTFLAQRHGEAVMTLEQFPINLRFENAIISYGRYLLKTVWPFDLAVIYPLPNHLSWIHAAAATSAPVLLLVSWIAWRGCRTGPYLLVGWLWFLGTLVPVIGLVQVGSAALADRYTYFPLIGIFIAAVFGVRDLAERFQFPKIILPAASVLILGACLSLTERQLSCWRDSESLFTHAIAVTRDNAAAEIDLGVALEQQGRQTEALAHYREAARISPENIQAHYNIGNLLDKLGQPGEALPEQREVVRLDPKSSFLHTGLGITLAGLGNFDEAMAEFSEAARLDPADPSPHFQMGATLLKKGRDTEAIEQLRAALRLDPENFQILAYAAHVLAADENSKIRDGKSALVLAVKANVITGGTQPQMLDALGMACAETGDFTNAMDATQRALDLANAAKLKGLEPLQKRLELYKNHQPWRESFLATNAPVGN
jgi:tetratricopeptide (TPR) repeat protein